MLKKILFLILSTPFFTFLTLHSQSPYGKVLVLDQNGTQNWIDIGTMLANYITYHPGTTSPTWLTNGNNTTSSAFLGTTNNQPLIFKTNNTERIRITENGDLNINGSLMPNGNAGTSGQVLTSQGSGTFPIWTTLPTLTESDPIYKGEIDVSGSSNNYLLRHNGTKYLPTPTGNLTSSTSGVTITGGSNAVIGSGTTFDIATASGSSTGLLSSTDWTNFNNKENALTKGNLTSSTSGVTITGGSNAVIGSGTTIDIATASGSSTGLLSSTDWNTFNNRWSLTGNSGTIDGTNYIGNIDNVPLNFRVNNQKTGRIASTGETFFGYQAGNSNTAITNTGFGYQALLSNTTGDYNTASGYAALRSNTTGNFNTASGSGALYSNTTGNFNTANGFAALYSNPTGNFNTALGYSSGTILTTGSNNIIIGYNAQPSSATMSNEVTIGNSSNNSYRMYAASWTNASDARYKHDIEDLGFGLDFIMKLKPRRYIYNNSTDNKITMGFVAQEIQSVMNSFGMDNYNLVKILEKDFLGLNTTEIIPILVKATQQQQQEIDKQQAQIVKLQQENEELKKTNEKYTSEIDKLRSEIENIKKHLTNSGAMGSAK